MFYWKDNILYLNESLSSVADPLEASIQKWEMIVKRLQRYSGMIGDGGRHTCALCVKFHCRGCRGCPVSEEVGKAGCVGTPYEVFNVAKSPPIQMVAAKAELKFLQRLQKIEDPYEERLKVNYGEARRELYLYFLNYVRPANAYQLATSVPSLADVEEMLEALP